MRLRTFAHAGLRRFYLKGQSQGVPPDSVDKLRRMLTVLQRMATPDELRTLPVWKAHRLTGDRAGTWSLHVTRNWRLTFRIDDTDNDYDLIEVNLENYH